jgi:hypothetical protein
LTPKLDNLFPDFQAVSVPRSLTESLEARPRWLFSEKARSEFIVAPLLLAVCQLSRYPLAIYSGHRFDVDAAKGLHGRIDFILAAGQSLPALVAPLASVVQAQNADIDLSYGLCAAQILAAQRFNAEGGNGLRARYGCITTGDEWQFIRLEDDTLTFDTRRFYLPETGLILAAFLTAIATAHATATATTPL